MQEQQASRRPGQTQEAARKTSPSGRGAAGEKTYSGSCHCGAVRFAVTVAVDELSACNYQFGRKTMHHLFRRTCGVHAFGRRVANGREKVIVNARCLDAVDVDALVVQTFDGKSY